MRRFLLSLVIAGIAACGGSEEKLGGDRGRGPSSGAAGSGPSTGNGSNGSGINLGTDNGSAPLPTTGGSNQPVPDNTKPVDGSCASADVSASRITPTVQLVIDGSGSMNAPFGGNSTRWQVLREALIGTSGVVTKLDPVVKFGMTIYSNFDPMACPGLVDVQPALMNFQTLSSMYPAQETGGGTPTGEALQKVVDALPDFANQLDTDARPPIIILATDGEPNGCAAGAACDWATDWAGCLGGLLGSLANAMPTYDSTLAAVRAAKAKNIPVWVISLADGLNNIPDLQKTANIGAGLDDAASPGAMIYSPTNPDDLTATLTKLIGDVVVCDITLAGTLAVNRACEGSVSMNGVPLECNSDQGWKPLNDKTISLQGEACAKFKNDPTVMLQARFPCDVVVPD